jgi:four helix bundle protein
MQDFQNLRVWHSARSLARRVHEVTGGVRPRRFAGQVSQLRRAALSIGANIAEGAAHSSPREFARFLQMALASGAEVEHHAFVAVDIDMLQSATADELVKSSREVQRMLVALRRKVLAPREVARAPGEDGGENG